MFALDTNTISYFFRGEQAIIDSLQAQKPSEVGVPSVVLYEIRYGLLRLPNNAGETRLQRLGQFMAPLSVLPFDDNAAQHAAQIRSDLESIGQGIGPHDVLIAATALAHGATLVTHNQKEFSRVATLTTVDWWQRSGT